MADPEGFSVPKDKDGKETLVVRVTVDAFGTLYNHTFFGMPAFSSAFIPIALPQLSIYEASKQRGHARWSMDVLDKTNRAAGGLDSHLRGRCLL